MASMKNNDVKGFHFMQCHSLVSSNVLSCVAAAWRAAQACGGEKPHKQVAPDTVWVFKHQQVTGFSVRLFGWMKPSGQLIQHRTHVLVPGVHFPATLGKKHRCMNLVRAGVRYNVWVPSGPGLW